MTKKHYDEVSVIRSLNKKQDISIDSVNKTIKITKDNTTVGIKSWGKISYLCKVHNYVYTMIGKITKSNKIKNEKDEDNENIKSVNKRNKLNMAVMSKNAMKKVSII